MPPFCGAGQAAKKATKRTGWLASKESSFYKESRKKRKELKKIKWGVKNSLVNNINARKEKVTGRPIFKKTVSKIAYKAMENKGGRK